MEIDVRDMSDPKNKTEKMKVPLIMPHELVNFLSDPCMHLISCFFLATKG